MSSDSPKPKGSAGWNDPPMFSYNSHIQGVQGTKLNLTKRVSFPLASGSPPSSQPIPVSAGPPILPSSGNLPPCIPSHLPESAQTSTTLNQPDKSHSDVQFELVYKNLEPQIEDISQVNERTASDIKKKVQLLESMWNENKFNSPLKSKILDLSKAILDKDVKTGDEIQRSLMVDHAALCSSWIPALRHLLNSLKSQQGEKTS